jgi:uncharacterized membrane protein YfcA
MLANVIFPFMILLAGPIWVMLAVITCCMVVETAVCSRGLHLARDRIVWRVVLANLVSATLGGFIGVCSWNCVNGLNDFTSRLPL